MFGKIGDKPEASLDKGSLELPEEYIRLRAYELFEQRGREHGHDIDDSLQAEAQIVGKKQQPSGRAGGARRRIPRWPSQ
jgi:hypothetical protein